MMKFSDICRGIVVDNSGEKGRCKIYVPGVYPSEYEKNAKLLPWAEPAMPLYGGSFTAGSGSLNTECGFVGWPKKGAHVWVFFEQGDWNYPIYFAAINAGAGWISEHNNQWVLRTDNVSIRVDEDPSSSDSTSKFDSYNKSCTHLSVPESEEDIPTRLDIQVKGNVHINITGSVNLKITGNVYSEIEGDVHETLTGNKYSKHVGDHHIVHEGDTVIERTGDVTEKNKGNKQEYREGDEKKYVEGSTNTIVSKVNQINVGEQNTQVYGNNSIKVTGQNDLTVIGSEIQYIEGDKKTDITGKEKTTITGTKQENVTGIVNLTSSSVFNIKGSILNLN